MAGCGAYGQAGRAYRAASVMGAQQMSICAKRTPHTPLLAVQGLTKHYGAWRYGDIGASGAGKSTLMRIIYGNYRAASGAILAGGLDVAQAAPREIIQLRRKALGYVSQFLRVVPRAPILDMVANPLLTLGVPLAQARARAETLLAWLNLPKRLWSLSPTTFSRGAQQRVNIARGFAHDYPAILLDEPTASLDPKNREVVLTLIEEAKARGAAIIVIFHDVEARTRVADRQIDLKMFAPKVAA